MRRSEGLAHLQVAGGVAYGHHVLPDAAARHIVSPGISPRVLKGHARHSSAVLDDPQHDLSIALE